MREPIAFSSKDYGADAGEISPTLRAAGRNESHANAGCPPAVVIDEVTHTLRGEGFDASEDGTGRGTPLVPVVDNHGGAMPKPKAVGLRLAVRRLTPRECERLQAWPDDHTLVGRRVKRVGNTWKIMGGVAHQADGPRYKQCGNGVTSTVPAWIGRRILSAKADV